MIDTTKEQLIPLAEAVRQRIIPPARQGNKTHISTYMRWILHSIRNPAGEIVRLEGIRLGGRWFISREAIQRFAERLTPPEAGNPTLSTPPTPRTPTARQRARDRAARELDHIGI